MSHTFVPWYTNTRLFFAFFRENPLALKLFVSALLSIPYTQISSCFLRNPAFCDHKTTPVLSVTITCPRTFHLDILLPSSDTHHTVNAASHTISLLPSSVPLLPSTPFLRVVLFNSMHHALYSEDSSSDNFCTTRFLNLSPFLPPIPQTPLYDFARFLLLTRSSECPSLLHAAAYLSPIIHSIEEHLKEREISSLFCEKIGFASPKEIRFMCTLNRLLIREKRFDELKEASENPESLMKLFEEYHRKGHF